MDLWTQAITAFFLAVFSMPIGFILLSESRAKTKRRAAGLACMVVFGLAMIVMVNVALQA